MRGMFEESVLPALLAPGVGNVAVGTVNIFGVPESQVDARIADMMPEDRNPAVGLKVDDGVVYVCLRARAETDEKARALLEQDAREIESRFGQAVFGRNDTTLPRAVSDLLERHNLKVAVAESCTGGLIGSLLTEVPGISRFFLADIVAYSNEVKASQLRVPAEQIRSFGAVSAQVAEAMARGACELTGAQLGIGVTGIAGPSGGTPEKPVGLVYIAICLDGKATVQTLNLKGDRQRIRDRAAKYALDFARLALLHRTNRT
jgi:nicotinamide-nucleotide amidase